MYYRPSMVLNVFLDQCNVLYRRREIFYMHSQTSRDHRNDFHFDFAHGLHVADDVDGAGDVTTVL